MVAGLVVIAQATGNIGSAYAETKIPVPKARPVLTKIPVPRPRPTADKIKAEKKKAEKAEKMSAEELTCRSKLRRAGVKFKPVKPIHGKGGCGIKHPISITGLPGGTKLSGKTVVACATGLALSDWTTKSVVPAAKKYLKKELTGIDQYATYDCRSRNSQSGTKLSEHAKGNAIDIGRFHLAGGDKLEVGSVKGKAQKKFMKSIRDAACSYFTTVLGPGSDIFHNDHFHFDIAKRRRGYRYCR